MRQHILYLFATFLLTLPTQANNEACIEPRNGYAGDIIADIQWSLDDSTFYISTMGKVWAYEVDEEQPRLVHNVCDGRFPVIGISEISYAVGSDFLPVLSIYDMETDELLYEIAIASENIRSIAFDSSGDYVALSTSNWTEDGFFDINRNIEIWNFRTGELLAELVPDENDPDAVYLPFGSRVSFIADDTVLVAGIDMENAFVLSQPMVYLWNWQTHAIESVNIEADTMIKVVGSDLAIIDKYGDASINLQVVHLLPKLQVDASLSYDILLGDYSETRFSGSSKSSLLAIENREGQIWVIDLNQEQIIDSRILESFATTLAFNHAGQRIALGYHDGTIQLWDLLSDSIVTIGDVIEA
jgi:WD40 repeat protein